MSFSHGPNLSWSTIEQLLSDRAVPPGGDGGDSPAWSYKRPPYVSTVSRRAGAVPYAELHCHSNFSFLDGASHPDELVEQAARLGLEALALTDHDGFYGVVRFAEAAKAVGLPTIFGAELNLALPSPRQGPADPDGTHLVVLARDPAGYARLARTISMGQRRGEKGRPVYDLADLAGVAGGHWLVLTGCRKGLVPASLPADRLGVLVDAFGRDNVAVELWDHATPYDTERNDALSVLADRHRVLTVATNNVHYATPDRHRLATVLAAVRARRDLDGIDGWLPSAPTAYLRSGAEQAARFARWPGAVARAAELGLSCAFDLDLIAPRLPDCAVPDGHTEASWLRQLAYDGARRRYGVRRPESEAAYQQIEKELALIEQLEFPGYFLIVHDIVQFCVRADILCQGRGSAANSAVCYALGITNVDSVGLKLLFERFLSPYRDGPPDIDLDIESGRREEVIQYVYDKYDRDHAAQVANVITYRARSAMRDTGRALGYAVGQLDAWSRQVDGWGSVSSSTDSDVPAQLVEMADELQGFPRHLGIHSGGMVICDRPVVEVCPVEWARMADRSVLQWDKDDCAMAGLVKFDLLGLGMLTALHDTLDLIADSTGKRLELWELPQEDPAVYDMLCAADSVGVFQVESRAQMATLPRLRPRTFSDLVIEIAIIRPGPIQGGSVHPYIRRRHGQEEETYLHELLRPALEKTKGVPLFQEQLMQIAIDVAGFSAAEADELRVAMGSKRSRARMEKLHDRLCSGMAAKGISTDIAEQIYAKLLAFANYGFPESHAVSFAFIVYASAWLKLYYPAAFLAGLLNAQPMGFYSPASLVADARRHGVVVHGPDVNASRAACHVDAVTGAVRLGLSSVRLIGDALAERLAAGAPYSSMADVARRGGLSLAQTEALATAGAFGCFGVGRRGALWSAGAVAPVSESQLDGTGIGVDAPELPAMSAPEQTVADMWALGLSPDSHVLEYSRSELAARGVVPAAALRAVPNGQRVLVGGAVIHRQRPSTAGGTTFVNLEDETGHINVICSRGVWQRYRRVARGSAGLLIRGRVENVEGVVNVVADRIEALPLLHAAPSRDFR
ncbi:MAG: error-prone polymerase [Frankiaceae bacterium]|jgi:error-prone DNA polymerase|nr:error-prone polymerase [Frankiaceae bacterium]